MKIQKRFKFISIQSDNCELAPTDLEKLKIIEILLKF